MPAVESFVHSQAVFQRYRLADGRECYISNGCLVDSRTGGVIVGSDQSADWLLTHAILTNDEREYIDQHARFAWPTSGFEYMKNQIQHQPTAGTMSELGDTNSVYWPMTTERIAPEEQISRTLTQLDVALAIIGLYMTRRGDTTNILRSLEVDMAPRAEIRRDKDGNYLIGLRSKMGS